MKIINLLWIVAVVNMATAQAFSFDFNVLGYKINYNKPQNVETIDNTNGIQHNFKTHEFDKYIVLANNDKYVQLFLKELDYERIGFIDKDTGNTYTIFVNQEGIITEIWTGLHNEDVTIKGSLSRIRFFYDKGDLNSIKDEVNIPFKMKLKILIMKWF